jgi:hypothetical protein
VKIGSVAVAVGLLTLATALQIVRDRTYADPNANLAAFLDVQSGAAMKRFALSYDALAADIYWIRAVQHFGGEHRLGGGRGYQLLYPLLDLTTNLDPRFNIAYRFGAIFLAEPFPGGAGRPDLAVALLQKGIAAQPQRWEYFQDVGFVYYWQLHDYKAAADWFERGSHAPGAPWWLRSLAAATLAKGGDRASSRFLWERLLQSGDNAWLRSQAELRLAQLDAMDQIDQLQAVVSRYQALTGRLPGSWADLARARLLRGEPADPSGAPYRLDSATGRVSLSPSSSLYPLPTEPPGSAARS